MRAACAGGGWLGCDAVLQQQLGDLCKMVSGVEGGWDGRIEVVAMRGKQVGEMWYRTAAATWAFVKNGALRGWGWGGWGVAGGGGRGRCVEGGAEFR